MIPYSQFLEKLPIKWQTRINQLDWKLIKFNQVVDVRFQDGSLIKFQYAYMDGSNDKELLVLTEHCGYYVFPYSMLVGYGHYNMGD